MAQIRTASTRPKPGADSVGLWCLGGLRKLAGLTGKIDYHHSIKRPELTLVLLFGLGVRSKEPGTARA